MRRFIALLLVCLTVWQSASAAGPLQVWLAADPTLAHVAMHEAGEAHHHHHDHDGAGATHADDSQDSVQHVMADCCIHHLAVFQAPTIVALEPLPQHVAQAASHLPPPPYLDGLRRPPRSLI